MAGVADDFREESAEFESRRSAWLAEGKEGRWVVIRGRDVLGLFATAGAAWRAGIDACGGPGFMLRRITREDRPLVVSRVALHRDPAQS